MKRRYQMPYYIGVFVLLLLLLGWVGNFATNKLADLTQELYDHPLVVSTAVLRVHANVISMHRAMKDIVLSDSPEAVQRYRSLVNQTEEKVLLDLILTEERFLGDPEAIRAARRSFLAWKPIRDEVIRLALAGKRSEAATLTQTIGSRQVEEIETKVNVVRDFARNKSQEFLADAKETRAQTIWFVWLSLGGALILAGVVAKKAVRIESTLQELTDRLELKVGQRTAELAMANENLAAQHEEITAMNEELTAQNEEITAMNEELEQRVAERTSDLMGAHQELTAQFEELEQKEEDLRRSAQIQGVLREITEAAVVSASPDELYPRVHQSVGRVLPVKNFFIALLDETNGEIAVPYCVDETGLIPQRRPVGKGLTEYAARLGHAVHLTRTEFEQLWQTGEINLRFVQINEWLGAPLRSSTGVVFGVIAMYTVDDALSYKPEDTGIMTIIAAQVSMVIERKRAEAELAERETQFSQLFENMSSGVAIYEAKEDGNDFVFKTVNRAVEKMENIKKEDVIGKSVLQVFPGVREFGIFDVFQQVWKTGNPVNHPISLYQDERIMGWKENYVYKLPNGEIVAIYDDTTQRMQAEELLAESEARYRAIIEQSPEAILICDPDTGAVIEANARFTERLGYAPERHTTLNLFELIDDEAEKIKVNYDRVIQSGILPLQRRRFKHCNGSVVSVERSAMLVRFRGRRLLVMTLRDVSDEVRREQEIRRDAQLATRVQNALLSAPEPSEFLDIATIYQPFGYVGGDLYFLDWRYDGSLLRGFLVDATGHGLSTALHTASMHVLLREVNELDLPLSDAMRWLNRRAGDYFDEGTFAGALGFEFDLDIRQLRWVCAGISDVWMATKTMKGAVSRPGMFLGIQGDETFETHMMQIAIGDSFYFMTDGLSDQLEPQETLPLDRHAEMEDMLGVLSKSEGRRDDATAVCIHVRALPQSLVRQDGWPRIIRFNGYGDYQRLKGEVAKVLAEVTGLPHSMQEVAVHEALANAMECRDGLPRQHKARLRFNKVGNRLIVRVKTSRIGFAGNAILRRLRSHPEDMFSFGEDASMGRGIPMMLSMSHKMTYNSEGTEVLLAWKL